MKVALSGWFTGRPVGSGRYTDQLLAALQQTAGDDDRFALIHHGGWRSVARKLIFEQVTFPHAARAADVAHVPYWAPPLWPRTPTVVTVHDLIPLLLPAYRRHTRVRAYTALVARATERASVVVADSAHTAADIRAHLGVPADRIHVVPLGVGPQFRPALPGAKDQPRPSGVPKGRYGLYLGGFDPRKNLPTLLTAWRHVFAATGVPLVIGGRLPEVDDAFAVHPLRAARRAGVPEDAVHPIGHVDGSQLPALLRGAAVFAYPSRYEGFGLPPLEAMACGTPVVVADATSLPEVVGDAGVLVPPDSPGSWADAIGRVLDDPVYAASLRAAGPDQASAFTWHRTAALTRAAYEHARAHPHGM